MNNLPLCRSVWFVYFVVYLRCQFQHHIWPLPRQESFSWLWFMLEPHFLTLKKWVRKDFLMVQILLFSLVHAKLFTSFFVCFPKCLVQPKLIKGSTIIWDHVYQYSIVPFHLLISLWVLRWSPSFFDPKLSAYFKHEFAVKAYSLVCMQYIGDSEKQDPFHHNLFCQLWGLSANQRYTEWVFGEQIRHHQYVLCTIFFAGVIGHRMSAATVWKRIAIMKGTRLPTRFRPAKMRAAVGKHQLSLFSTSGRICDHQYRCLILAKVFSTAKCPPLTEEECSCSIISFLPVAGTFNCKSGSFVSVWNHFLYRIPFFTVSSFQLDQEATVSEPCWTVSSFWKRFVPNEDIVASFAIPVQ